MDTRLNLTAGLDGARPSYRCGRRAVGAEPHGSLSPLLCVTAVTPVRRDAFAADDRGAREGIAPGGRRRGTDSLRE
jgi:hypothetical protein